MQYLFIGILLGIVIDKYIFPLIDTLFEVFTYKISIKATAYKIQSESIAREYEKKYPEVEETATNVVGFHMDNSEEYYDDDIEEDCKNKIGFKI